MPHYTGQRSPPRAPRGGREQAPLLPDETGEPHIDMENYDEGFESDVDDEAFFDDPRDTFTGDQAYNQAVSRAQLAKTYYVKKVDSFVERSTLFPDTKSTLKTIAHGLFDKTEVLAKTENVNIEYIDVEIILAQARIGFHPMDVDNPDLTTVMNMILHHYKRYISRSVNGWERGLQNVIETAHTNRIENRPQFGGQMQPQQKPWYRRWI